MYRRPGPNGASGPPCCGRVQLDGIDVLQQKEKVRKTLGYRSAGDLLEHPVSFSW
jgi:hypothetical protein